MDRSGGYRARLAASGPAARRALAGRRPWVRWLRRGAPLAVAVAAMGGCNLVVEPLRATLELSEGTGGDGGASGAVAVDFSLGGSPVWLELGTDVTAGGDGAETPADAGFEVCGEGTRGETPEPSNVAVFLVVDRSGRMVFPLERPVWPSLVQALYSLAITPPAPDLPLKIALTLFPIEEYDGDRSLRVDTYAEPQVPLDVLTANNAPLDEQEARLIKATLSATLAPIQVSGRTIGAPTVQALRGTMGSAVEYAIAHPDDRTVVLLMTGGVPTAEYCHPYGNRVDPTSYCLGGLSADSAPELVRLLEEVAQAGALADPPVRTYAIAFSESFAPREDLARVAAAGNGRCFNCDAVEALDDETPLEDRVFSYLRELAENEFACQYPVALPDNAAVLGANLELVNVRYRDGDGPWGYLRLSNA